MCNVYIHYIYINIYIASNFVYTSAPCIATPPTPGPAVNFSAPFEYASASPCDYDPRLVPPANVIWGPGGGPPAEPGRGPCELPLLGWEVPCPVLIIYYTILYIIILYKI